MGREEYEEAWRARIRRDERPDPGAPSADVGNLAFLGRVLSPGPGVTPGDGKFLGVQPSTLLGDEVEGGGAVLQDLGLPMLAVPVGIPPAAGSMGLVTDVRFRWAMEVAGGCPGCPIDDVDLSRGYYTDHDGHPGPMTRFALPSYADPKLTYMGRLSYRDKLASYFRPDDPLLWRTWRCDFEKGNGIAAADDHAAFAPYIPVVFSGTSLSSGSEYQEFYYLMGFDLICVPCRGLVIWCYAAYRTMIGYYAGHTDRIGVVGAGAPQAVGPIATSTSGLPTIATYISGDRTLSTSDGAVPPYGPTRLPSCFSYGGFSADSYALPSSGSTFPLMFQVAQRRGITTLTDDIYRDYLVMNLGSIDPPLGY